MYKKYYSQHQQDKTLEEMIFKGYKNGFFVDVGAYDGITLSNCLYFEETNNWTGINIEPMPDMFEKLKINRPNCINLNVAIDEKESESSEFVFNTGHTAMLSGLKQHYDPRHLERIEKENKEHHSKSEMINVKTRKLSSIFEEYKITRVNYLSIDVEGAEASVIDSIDFDKVFIDVIGIENNFGGQTALNNMMKLFQRGYVPFAKNDDILLIHKMSPFNVGLPDVIKIQFRVQ